MSTSPISPPIFPPPPPPPPPISSTILYIIFALVFMCMIWCYIVFYEKEDEDESEEGREQLLSSSQQAATAATDPEAGVKRSARGFDQLVVERLEISQQKNVSSSTGFDCDRCAICWEDMRTGSMNLLHLRCNHIFHTSCVEDWRDNNTSTSTSMCPLCRASMVD